MPQSWDPELDSLQLSPLSQEGAPFGSALVGTSINTSNNGDGSTSTNSVRGTGSLIDGVSTPTRYVPNLTYQVHGLQQV